MPTWWAETNSVVPDDFLLAEFFRILANSHEFSPANEIEQNRFLTLRAGLILVSNGVYIRNCEITKLGISTQFSILASQQRFI